MIGELLAGWLGYIFKWLILSWCSSSSTARRHHSATKALEWSSNQRQTTSLSHSLIIVMPIHSVKLCQHTDRHLGNLSKQTMCGVSSAAVVLLLYWALAFQFIILWSMGWWPLPFLSQSINGQRKGRERRTRTKWYTFTWLLSSWKVVLSSHSPSSSTSDSMGWTYFYLCPCSHNI